MATTTDSLRALAQATPASRERYADFLRALAICGVVIGHWLAVVITSENGRLSGEHALALLPWAHWLTWLFQVMGIFFVVGGYANTASWDSHRERGGTYLGWLGRRADRLLRPTTLFLAIAVTGAALARLAVTGAALARLAGVDVELVQNAAWLMGISLWFLAVYVAVVAVAPALIAIHRRWGLAAFVGTALAVALADLARFGFGLPLVAAVNYGLVWAAIHQLGVAWRDEELTRPPVPALLAVAGALVLVVLVTLGPYAVSMVGVPGAEVDNTSPPTLALLALAGAHTGQALLLRGRISGWLRRQGPWMMVIALNSVIMTLYLWHMVPVVFAALGLYATGIMPQPAPGSGAWLALRPLWVGILAILLAAVVLVVGRWETSPIRRGARRAQRAPGPADRPLAVGVALLGCAAGCAGLALLTLGGLQGAGPAGVPVTGLGLYLGGVALIKGATGAGGVSSNGS